MKNQKYRPSGSLSRIVFLLVMITLLLASCGCQRKIYIPVETVKVISDSTSSVARVNDYINMSDSVTIIMKGDTLIRDRIRTVTKHHIATDTLIKQHVDTIRIEVPVIVKENKPADRKSNWNFIPWLIMSIILIIIFFLIKKIRTRSI